MLIPVLRVVPLPPVEGLAWRTHTSVPGVKSLNGLDVHIASNVEVLTPDGTMYGGV